ncbi:hypothetical protein RHMOL_Rhmol06G0254400 [Rhododendron molle]|uniref:Uncharacterized protein n=8 Tax=Rhododendron molle TaxID=49168 RepID=A0ACC0NI71_RHOML|nr:hypothetical protein RHMOL_Rhmol06G0254400 [Rhododendron molle]KAI8552277.1 hypothetical protein RHMOL_Rhmol06G0254400 [Rhododendron molle]KAI8552278.1 hypothetical protein RHMOL_Rhmol06G0254400 [Rhododendron molle]KAI8552279.1 hypothetical protein RHMOL_Rhmol06G0254400 [Rhododendron molle]KAI8552280.1 hypothetical protein RHMOL_Rhmol06G0254400 [Rhododendron molle]
MVDIFKRQMKVSHWILLSTSITRCLVLISIGLMNRAVGATALNKRSSRFHRIGLNAEIVFLAVLFVNCLLVWYAKIVFFVAYMLRAKRCELFVSSNGNI